MASFHSLGFWKRGLILEALLKYEKYIFPDGPEKLENTLGAPLQLTGS